MTIIIITTTCKPPLMAARRVMPKSVLVVGMMGVISEVIIRVQIIKEPDATRSLVLVQSESSQLLVLVRYGRELVYANHLSPQLIMSMANPPLLQEESIVLPST